MAHAGGRPTLYDARYVDQAYEACLAGATDALLAEQFGVAESTINAWKLEYPEFSEALKRGKHPANNRVASKLYEKACGYEYEKAVPFKVKTVTYKDGKRLKEVEKVVTVMVHEIVPPDTTAAIFWLKNRRPDLWRDKQEVDHTITDLSKLTDEELARRRKALGLA